jgi:uncharacterized pyridoxal phosphate-containing UPF0001 family protein
MTDPEPTARDQRFADVAARVTSLRRRLEDAGGSSVRVVAVTKGFGVEEIEAAVAAGVDDIGENYAQEYRAKREALATDGSPTGGAGIATWHFIGQLQRNKVRLLSGLVDVWQTLDRPALAREIARLNSDAQSPPLFFVTPMRCACIKRELRRVRLLADSVCGLPPSRRGCLLG